MKSNHTHTRIIPTPHFGIELYTYRQTDRQTYIHTHTHTHTHTYRQTHLILGSNCIHTYIHTDRQTHIHAYNRGACALTCAGGSPYTNKLKSACREPDLSPLGLDPVSLSKVGTSLLASLVNKGENRNPLLASEMHTYRQTHLILGSNYILTYIQTDRQTHIHAYTHTHTHTHTHIQTDTPHFGIELGFLCGP